MGQERVKKLAFGDGASRFGELARRIRDSTVALVMLVPIVPSPCLSHLETASGCSERRRANQRVKL